MCLQKLQLLYKDNIKNQDDNNNYYHIDIYRCRFCMELFADIRDARYFNESHEHQWLLRDCFGDVIQKDL